MGRQNQCCFCISYLFLLTLSELLSEDKLKLRNLATCWGHLEIDLTGSDSATLKSPGLSHFKSTDMPGACLLINFVLWCLSVGSLASWQISGPTTPSLEFSKPQKYVIFLTKYFQEPWEWNHGTFVSIAESSKMAHVKILLSLWIGWA